MSSVSVMCVNFLNAGVWGLLRSVADLGFEKEGGDSTPLGTGSFCTTSLIALISPTKLKWFKMGAGGGGAMSVQCQNAVEARCERRGNAMYTPKAQRKHSENFKIVQTF